MPRSFFDRMNRIHNIQSILSILSRGLSTQDRFYGFLWRCDEPVCYTHEPYERS